MDKDGERKQLEEKRDFIVAYQNHVITKQYVEEDEERENLLRRVILDEPVTDIQSFFVHWTAVGELQAIKKRRAMLTDRLDEIEEKIKEL